MAHHDSARVLEVVDPCEPFYKNMHPPDQEQQTWLHVLLHECCNKQVSCCQFRHDTFSHWRWIAERNQNHPVKDEVPSMFLSHATPRFQHSVHVALSQHLREPFLLHPIRQGGEQSTTLVWYATSAAITGVREQKVWYGFIYSSLTVVYLKAAIVTSYPCLIPNRRIASAHPLNLSTEILLCSSSSLVPGTTFFT
jgi:hypothetical protein